MRLNLSNIKFYTILISLFYLFGLIGLYYSLKIPIAVVLAILTIFPVLKNKLSLKKSIILFLIFILGTIRAQQSLNIDETLKNITSNNAYLKGQIVSSKDISYKTNKVKFYLNVKEADFLDGAKDNRNFKDINSKVLISSSLDNSIENNVMIGDYIEIKGKFTIPVESTNPHEFNYKKYLLNNDCYNILYANPKSFKIIKSPKFSYKNPLDSWFYILQKFEITRNKIIKKHSKHIKSPKLEVLGGIVFGDETINPDEKIKENFKNSGLLHLLAASGLNVALIYGIWWWIAGFIKLPFRISIISGAVFVVLYTFMTGFPPSILRAGIMLLFVLFGKIIDRNVSSSALIFFAGFLILLFSPKMLFDIGFQLSFMVTFGLIVCCPIVLSKFKEIDEEYKEKYKDKIKDNRLKRYLVYIFMPSNIVSVIVVPLVAQLWVIPLQMHYFNNLAPLSVLANVAVVPFIGILSFIGFISSIFALIPYLNDVIVYCFDLIANPLLELLIKISEIFGSFKFSLITTVGMSLFQILVFWAILLLTVLNIKNNFKNKIEKLIMLMLIVLFVFSFVKVPFCSVPEVMMFDLSNDNSILIKSKNNKYLLYDISNSKRGFSKTETVIKKYLQNERIKRLDFVIIPTDYKNKKEDTDNLSLSIKVNKIIDNLNSKNNEIILDEKDFKIKILKAQNESIYLLLNYKDKNIFFMNDYEINDFKSIEKLLPSSVEILKVPYKENKIIADKYLIERLKPNYVLISDDFNPKDKGLSRLIKFLYEKEIKIIQTKDYGFIKLILNEKEIKFYNFDKHNNKLRKIKFYDRFDFAKSSYMVEFINKNQ